MHVVLTWGRSRRGSRGLADSRLSGRSCFNEGGEGYGKANGVNFWPPQAGALTLKVLRRKDTGQHEMQDEVIKAKKL